MFAAMLRNYSTKYLKIYHHMPPVQRGILLMVVSTFGFTVMHAVIRYLSSDMHPFEIAFFRNLFGLIALVPFLMRQGFGVLRTDNLGLHCLRGFIQIFAMLSFFYALSITELAKISAISFTAPLFATIGAVIFLGEIIRVRRILALAFGFIGAMVIIRPGLDVIEPGTILVLGSSAIWALAMLIIKVLTRTESPITITAYMGLILTPLSLIAAVFFWQWPSWTDLLLFCLMGVSGSMAHVAIAQAFKEADTSVILPFDFTRLIWASLLGFLLFGEIPAQFTWIGGAIIFASTTYIAIREANIAKQQDTNKPRQA